MKKQIILIICCLLITTSFAAVNRNNPEDVALFNGIFTQWSKFFNTKDTQAVCRMFSADITATNRGRTPRNKTMICNDLKRVLKSDDKYHYDFKINNIYRSNDLAAVRITWILTATDKKTHKVTKTIDEGLDVFQLMPNGQWQIVNFLSYSI